MLRCPRTYSGRASVPPGRSVCTVGFSADGHGRAALAACSGLTCAAESSVHPGVSAQRPGGFPREWCGRGRAGALMAGSTVRESVTLAGRAERARVARTFVSGVLGPGHPCGDDAALLVSELFGNSVRYSQSGATVTVTVRRGTAWCGSRSSERGWDAGSVPCWPRCGRRSRASGVIGVPGRLAWPRLRACGGRSCSFPHWSSARRCGGCRRCRG